MKDAGDSGSWHTSFLGQLLRIVDRSSAEAVVADGVGYRLADVEIVVQRQANQQAFVAGVWCRDLALEIR